MEKATLVLKVGGVTSDKENELTNSLIEDLNREVRGIDLDRKKEDSDSLDPGTIIIAVIGTKFAAELVKTLKEWLMRDHSATLKIGRQGEIEMKGVSPDNLAEIVKLKLSGSSVSNK
ncbi:hypothetical protein EVC45_41160 [Paraburkholderia sp. UYCP14C]|uniref:hypothetical protein n=1 Tax=Paraburkholderia sp. UYCP14C TaxID=2511130 RepID=UPI0010206DDC|nr:hypothetical protein [Paraburkholderia sp. UYCP14C]RZF24018.1 hypothetical protein EVC45_41160 [Paraburkholderia sp. UYCP14C]